MSTQRFQFRLQDMYLVIAAIFASLLLVSAMIKDYTGVRGIWQVTMLTMIVFGALVGVDRANRSNREGGARFISVFGTVVLSWVIAFVILCFCCIPFIPCGGWPRERHIAIIPACKAFAQAEELYFKLDPAKTGSHQYAQSLRDLFETIPGKGDLALIDKTFANAEGPPEVAMPKAGYCFKVLAAQGPHAKAGAKSFVIDGKMTGGYALLAYPGAYDSTGDYTLMMNQDGIVYQKDLGEKTSNAIKQITTFDPDESWSAIEAK